MLKGIKKGDWVALVNGGGKVASVLDPAVGSGLIMAGGVIDKLNDDPLFSNDDMLENNVIGLTRCNEILENYIYRKENGLPTDDKQLILVLVSLQSLNRVLDKTFAIIK